jgi:hypothetical protein
MRILSKFIVLCNICFLVAAIFHYAGLFRSQADFPQPLNFLKGTIVILAEFGWILNLLFVLVTGVLLLARKPLHIPKWILWFNAVVLVLQIYYYFFDKT